MLVLPVLLSPVQVFSHASLACAIITCLAMLVLPVLLLPEQVFSPASFTCATVTCADLCRYFVVLV